MKNILFFILAILIFSIVHEGVHAIAAWLLNEYQAIAVHLFLYVIVLFMLGDAFNLSTGPFIWGGDVQGIALGTGINQYVIQSLFFFILLLNRELIVLKLLPEFKIKTRHPLMKPLVKTNRLMVGENK